MYFEDSYAMIQLRTAYNLRYWVNIRLLVEVDTLKAAVD
jgi:hypothetical protein